MLTNLLLVLLLLERIHARLERSADSPGAAGVAAARWEDIIDRAEDALHRPVVVPEGSDH